MANKCKKCGNRDNYNFALNIEMCNICIGRELERIKELEDELEKHRWIHVSERLPEFGKYHLAYDPNHEPHISVEIETGKKHRSHFTHWKPINQPEQSPERR